MASENVTTKFKVDISDLKKNVTEANKQVKLYRAELANASAGMAKGEETAESLTKKIEAQSKIVEAEKTKLQALKDELAKYESKLEEGQGIIDDLTEKHRQAAEAYGENSEEAKKYAEQLKKAQEAQERNETAADNLRTKIVNQDTAVKNAEGQVSQYSDALDNLGKEEENVGKEAQKSTDGGLKAFSVMLGNLATKVITGVIGKLKDMAQATVDAYKTFDDGRDNLLKATGASGAAADDLTNTYANVAKKVAGDLGSIGSAVGEVNTRFGYTGEELEKASVLFEKFADITGTDAVKAVQLISRAMGDAGIDADQYAEVLDQVAVAAQASGISVDKLTEYLTKYGAPMRALGFETKEAIALFSQWEKAGVNTEIAFSGMKAAIGTWGKEGKDAREEFKKTLTEIKNAPSIAAATTMAIKNFGQKAGPDLADAIQGGRFEYQDFLEIVENSAGTVEKTFEATQSIFDKMEVSMQELKITAAEGFAVILQEVQPVLEQIFPIVSDFVKLTVPALKDFLQWVEEKGGEILEKIQPYLEKAQETVQKIAEDAIPIVKAFLQWVKDNGDKIATLVAGITGAIVGMKAAAALTGAITAFKSLAAAIDLAAVKQWILNGAMIANPFGAIAAAVVGLAAAFVTAYKTSDTFREKVNLLWESTIETIEMYVEVFKKLGGEIKLFWESLTETVEGFFDSVRVGWGMYKDFINGIIGGLNKIPGVDIPLIGTEVPQMARGGIVSRPTIAQIGEAGREAVIPLDRNTAGLHEISRMLAQDMRGGSAASGSTSVNLTQNITSPKALSQYEIWRQTRNLLRLVKAEGV